MDKRTLIVSNSNFYGGGESFVSSVLSQLDNSFFLVYNENLLLELKNKQVAILKKANIFDQLKETLFYINKWNIDTIILNGGSTIYFAPFIRNKKIIIYRHTTNKYVNPSIKRWIYIIILHFCYLFANKIIHVSKYSQKEQKLFNQKAITIYNGIKDEKVQLEKNKDSQEPLNLLFLGRVTESKGIKEILEAFSNLKNENIILNIVGTGDLLDILQKQYSTNKRIIFHGFHSNVSDFYKHADIFIALSHMENCPFVLIDAMKWGIPIIATPVGGIPELVKDGINGFLVKNKNEAINAINHFLQNRDSIIQMGKCSRKIYQDSFTINSTIYKIKEIIANI